MPHTPPFTPDRDLFPFRSRWFDSRTGGRVHYLDEGEGQPILLLHGNPTWSFLWRGVIIRLRKHYRCIAPDYPGFGLSEHPDRYGYTPQEHADVVLELVRHLDLKGLTIVGHDWGGPIGMKVALDETHRLRSLVMGNTWYWPLDAWHMKAFAYLMSTEPVQNLILKRNLFVERLLPLGCKHDLAPEVLEHYREPLPTPSSREGVAMLPRQLTGASFWLEELAYAVPRRLGAIPLLLAWGVDDLAFPSRFKERFREDFRTVTVQRLEARHFIQEDDPVGMAEAIRAFLTERATDEADGAAEAPREGEPREDTAEESVPAETRSTDLDKEAADAAGNGGPDEGTGDVPAEPPPEDRRQSEAGRT